MPGEGDGRVDNVQKPPNTVMSGKGTISSSPGRGGGREETAYTGLQSEYSLVSLCLGHSAFQDGLFQGSGDVSLVWISSWQKQCTAYLPSLPYIPKTRDIKTISKAQWERGT